MYQFIFLSFALLSLALILLFTNLIISKKSLQDREKTSPFECGFDPITKNRLPFSNHFFIISMIFLIFDIEIALLIPLIYLTKYLSIYSIFTAFMFLMILLLGLFIEYSEQSIDWKI